MHDSFGKWRSSTALSNLADWKLLTFTVISCRADTDYYYGAIDMAHDVAIRLKLPFPAAVNR